MKSDPAKGGETRLQDSGFKKKDKQNYFPQTQSLNARGGEPEVMKKVVNSVLASALALSVAPMVVGAEETPQVDPKFQNTINRLMALDLVKGDDKGQLNLDQPINRAEFATLMVRVRGLESGVPLSQYQARFTDILPSDWWSGYINVASGQGLVKGYPDNTFGPTKNVTYAEAATMLVRALGYEPAVPTTGWPNNYVAKAAQLGVSDGVNIDPGKPATRGDVFMMLNNSLTIDLMKQRSYGDTIEYREEPGTSLVQEYLNINVYDMDWVRNDKSNHSTDLPFVAGVPVVELGELKDDEVRFTSSKSLKGTYKVAKSLDVNQYAGQHVQVWVKKNDDFVVWMEESTDEEVVNGLIDTLYNKTTEIEGAADIPTDYDDFRVKLDNGSRYNVNKDTVYVYNYRSFKNDYEGFLEAIIQDSDLEAGAWEDFNVKAVLDGEGNISYLHVVDGKSGDMDTDYKFGSEVVKEVDVDEKIIEFLDSTDDLDLDDDREGLDFIVLRNGTKASLADIKPLDVVSVYYPVDDKEKKIIVAISNTVEGEVTEIDSRSESDNRVTIDGKTYRFRGDVTYSENGNKTVKTLTRDRILDLVDDTVILYLDQSGWVRHIELKDGSDKRSRSGVLVRDAYLDPKRGDISFDVLNSKGEVITLEVDDEDDFDFGDKKDRTASQVVAELQISNSKQPIFVEYSLDKDGDVNSVTVTKIGNNDFISAKDFKNNSDKDKEYVKVGRTTYDITDDTIVFDLTGALKEKGSQTYIDKAKLTTFDKVAEKEYPVYIKTDRGEVEYLFVVGDKQLASSGHIGVINRFIGGSKEDAVEFYGSKDRVVLDGNMTDLQRRVARKHAIYYELNANDELVVKSAETIYDNKKMEILLDYVGDDKNKSFVEAARADVVDGSRSVVYESEDGDIRYNISSDAVIYHLEDDKIVSRVAKNDIVIMIDSDDDDDRVDFIFVIDNARNMSKSDIEKILGQKPGEGPKDPDPVDPDPVDWAEDVTGQKKAFLGDTIMYAVTGKVTDSNVEEVVVTVAGNKKTVKVESDGTFTAEFLLKDDAADFEVSVEGKDAYKGKF